MLDYYLYIQNETYLFQCLIRRFSICIVQQMLWYVISNTFFRIYCRIKIYIQVSNENNKKREGKDEEKTKNLDQFLKIPLKNANQSNALPSCDFSCFQPARCHDIAQHERSRRKYTYDDLSAGTSGSHSTAVVPWCNTCKIWWSTGFHFDESGIMLMPWSLNIGWTGLYVPSSTSYSSSMSSSGDATWLFGCRGWYDSDLNWY